MLINNQDKLFKLFSVFHKPFIVPNINYILPIQAGKAIANIDLQIEGDNTGVNISQQNGSFCELTVLYNIWKNNKQGNVMYWGLCHYRRYFCIDMHWTKIKKKDVYFYNENEVDFYKIFSKKFEKTIASKLQHDTVLVARPYHLIDEHKQPITVEQHYIKDHDNEGWHALKKVVNTMFPSYTKSFEIVSKQKYLHCYNMMIAHTTVWNEYLDWLFAILFEVNKIYQPPNNLYQSRALGFMAERLMNVYIYHKKLKIIAMPIAAIM